MTYAQFIPGRVEYPKDDGGFVFKTRVALKLFDVFDFFVTSPTLILSGSFGKVELTMEDFSDGSPFFGYVKPEIKKVIDQFLVSFAQHVDQCEKCGKFMDSVGVFGPWCSRQ